MKRSGIVLLVALFSHSPFAQTSSNHYLYFYDGGGNIISRVKTLLRDGQNDMSDNDSMRGEDNRVTIKADASWSEVQIEIIGEIMQGDILFIHTSEGFLVKIFHIESNKFSLNLSALREGTYLFRFKLSKKQSQIKYLKVN